MIQNIFRGEIYLARLSPVLGSEQGGVRPVVILQNDIGNQYSDTTIVAMLTSNFHDKAKLPTHVLVSEIYGLKNDSIIMLEQIRTIDKRRLLKRLGTINKRDLVNVEKCLKISLGILNQ